MALTKVGGDNFKQPLAIPSGLTVAGVVTATTFSGSFTGALTGTATSTTNIPNLTGAITSSNTTTSLGSFSSSNLATALTDETGSGAAVFATSPTLSTVTVSSGGINVTGVSTFSGGIQGNVTGNVNSSGVSTFSSVNVTGNVSIGGTLTYDDVTNVDSIGLVTARSGVRIDAGGLVVTAGVSTFTTGPVIIGATTPTGTASQPLQVTGGAYVSGFLGVGSTIKSYSSSESLEVKNGYAAFINPSATVAPIYAYNTDTTSSTNQPYITLSDNSGNRGAIGVNYTDSALWIHGQNGIRFRGGGSSPGTTEWGRFDSNGNLGIGTNNPTAKLQVVGSTDLNKLNLSGISSSISSTAVDVFVYDTRKDSDGGAWRKRTQNTSWYNETLNTATRGSRKDFPAVAVIVATTTTVTIYDGDDPDMPMWMVFNSGSGKDKIFNRPEYWSSYSLYALNGIICITTDNSIAETILAVNYASDSATLYPVAGYSSYGGVYSFGISGRSNSSGTFRTISQGIVWPVANDVAMTVLPNAPIDAATGLPVPTIIVGTNGGASIIKDDGTVINWLTTVGYVTQVSISKNYEIFAGGGDGIAYYAWYNKLIPTSSSNNSDAIFGTSYSSTSLPRLGANGNSVVGRKNVFSNDTIYFGEYAGTSTNNKLIILNQNTTHFGNSLVAYATTSYNTGWMHGDIKGAWLSDTSTASVTGTELITNGTFTTNTTGWSNHPDYPSAVLSIDTNRLKILGGGAQQSFSTVIGKTYVVVYTLTAFNPGGIYLGTAATGTAAFSYFSTGSQATGTYVYYFTAVSTTTYITLFAWNAGTQYAFYDDVSVRLTELDRSVNNKGLAVYGTITKTAVATGSNLVGYSGFSASNLLRSTAIINYGSTATITFMGWQKITDISNYSYYASVRDSTSSRTIGISINSSATADAGRPYLYDTVNGSLNSTIPINDGNWHFVVGVLDGTIKKLYIDGVLNVSATVTALNLAAVNNTSIGNYFDGSDGYFHLGSISLVRLSASVPSPTQIAKIYNDEKVLFQENSQATLYGASDAVTALAYDDSNSTLLVGTSSGRSDFRGLERINNTTTAVTTAISASNGLIVEQ